MICDLAETYHILDYRELPADLLAALVFGLRPNSRVKMALTGQKLTLDQMLMLLAVDDLNLLVWSKTKGAKNGSHRPKSLFQKITGKKKDDNLVSFESPEEFEKYMQQFNKED